MADDKEQYRIIARLILLQICYSEFRFIHHCRYVMIFDL